MKEECPDLQSASGVSPEDVEMACELCHKKEKSKTRCINGH